MNTAAQPLPDFDQPLPGLTEEALQWLVDLHAGDASETQWDAYHAWCERSPAHQGAATTAERLWRTLGSALERPKPRRRSGPLLGLALAAGLAGGGYWQAQHAGWMADQHTGTGERRHLQLADGSQLELAPHTRVDIDLRGSRRVLHLYAGELFVQVAPDKTRPFEVRAANGSLRALGTGFDVRRDGARVQLVVTEHSVGVTLPALAGQQVVQAGQRLTYDEQGVSAAQPIDAASATAWRRDRLVFDARPLGEVLDELGRYHSGIIWVRDPALRNLPVTGLFDTRNLDAQLALLQQSLPLRVRKLPWLTVLERDDTRPAK